MAIDAGYTITAISGKNGTDGQNGASLSVQYSVDGTSNWHDTFASGDIYMRQKLGNGSWSSAMKIVGEDGKNAITMTSATTPSGKYNGQIGFWQGQPYTWNGTSWEKQIGDLPTDAVLHYSFDEVPDYPDGTADVRLIDNNTYDLQGMSQKFNSNGGTTFTNNNGYLQITIATAGRSQGAYIPNTYIKNKVIKIKIKVLSLTGPFSIQNGLGNTIKSFTSAGTYEIVCVGTDSTANYNNLYIISNYSSDLIVEAIYIGNGSYSTPIIDNANGQNNATNNGGLAVKGVSGKGAYFLNGKYANIGTDFQLNVNFTVSLWVKPDNNTNGLIGNIISKASQFILRNGADWGNYLMLYIYDDEGTNIVTDGGNIGTLLSPTEWTHLVITRNETTCNIYKNGVKTHEKTLANNRIGVNNNPFFVCRYLTQYNTRPQSLDDLLIFNRALSDTEVQALYQNKANTPKYYDLSDYSIEQIDDDNVVDHLTEKPQLLSKWLEIYNAKNVSSSLPTSNVSASGEYKGVIDSANEVGVIETDAVQAYITASNALRSALWGTNGYLVDMNKDSALSGSLDSLFSTYRQTLQKARTVISEQQASSASALTIVNSNPFCLIPVNTGGTVTTYENTGLRLQVFNGVTQLTPKASSATLSEGQWKVTANGSNITAGSQTVGNGYIDFGNVSALNADTAVITFTITALVNGVTNTLYTTQKFSKSKEGADGRIYSLQTDTGTIAKADSGTLTPSSVTVKAYSWTGSASPALYGSGDLKAYENNVQIGQTVSQGNTITVTPSGNYPLVVKLFVHGTNTLIDTLTIPVLKDGHSPTVTATKSGTQTTIAVDGVTQATIDDGEQGSRAIRYLGKSATKPNSSHQTSGAPTGLATPISGDWYFCTTDGAVYYRSDSSTGTTYTWTVITWLDTSTVPDYRLTACLEDMLELSDQITTNQTMNNFIDKYTTVLIANEGFINKLRAKDINFKNSVSSYKDSGYVAGDLAISMGKNPKNEEETDNNFLIQSFVTALNKSSSDSTQIEQWKKDFYTQYNKDERTVDFFLNGIINAIYGLQTYQPIYCGSDILEQNTVSLPASTVISGTAECSHSFVKCGNYVYSFQCYINYNNHSQDKLYICRAPLPQDGLSYNLTFTSRLQVSIQDAVVQKAVCCNDKIYLQIYSNTITLLEYDPSSNTTRTIKSASNESRITNLMLFENNTMLYINSSSKVRVISVGSSSTTTSEYNISGTRMYKIGLHKYILFHNDYEMTIYNSELKNDKALGYKNFTNSLVYEDGVSIGSIYNLLGNRVFNIGATNDKIIVSGKVVNSNTQDYYILCSSDFGKTFDVSLKYTLQNPLPSGTRVPDFLFYNIYQDNGLILLNGGKSFVYSLDNGKTFTPYLSSGLNGNYLGDAVLIETPECKDLIIPIASEASAGSTNTVLDLVKMRSRNVSKPYRIRIGKPENPLNGDFWIE